MAVAVSFPICSSWSGCSAQFEDVPDTGSLNHFFDPESGKPLTLFGIEPGDGIFKANYTSPDWILQDKTQDGRQEFS